MDLKLGSKVVQPSTVTQSAVATPSLDDNKHRAFNLYTDEACPICQEPVGQRTPEGKVESWSRLPCGHKFGSHCIKHWLGIWSPNERPCCPICRRNAAYICGHPVLPELVPTTTTSTFTKTTTVKMTAAPPKGAEPSGHPDGQQQQQQRRR